MNRVLAIAGGSGSGKSTLARALSASLGQNRIAVLPVDAYYRDLSHVSPEDREAVNFDHPDALDLELFAHHVAELREGRSIACPTYDFTTHCRLPKTQQIEPRDWILVEGILVAATARLRAAYDCLVFVDTPRDVRWRRRLDRDQRERGRDSASIERFWTRAEDTFEEWGSAALPEADVLINGAQTPAVMMRELLERVSLE